MTTQRAEKQRAASFVYFVQAGEAGPIKIGVTHDPASRLRTLQVGNHEPLRMIGLFFGTADAEEALRRRFEAHRVRGEWFSPDEEIVRAAAALTQDERLKVPVLSEQLPICASNPTRDVRHWAHAKRLPREEERPAPPAVPDILDDLFDRLADLIADRVAEKLAARGAAPAAPVTPELATAKHNPLGSARAFLDAARLGKFPSGMRGRERVAKWADVAAYDLARLRPRPPKKPLTPPAPTPSPPTVRTDADRVASLARSSFAKGPKLSERRAAA